MNHQFDIKEVSLYYYNNKRIKEKLKVNNNIMSEIVYTIPSTDIFLSMKN